MATDTQQASGIPTSWKAAAVVVGLLLLVGYGSAQGWWGSGSDESEEDSEQEITWTVLWGQMRATGEVYEDTGRPKHDLVCDERDLTITTFVDGEPRVHDQYDSEANRETEPCTWRWHQTVPRGSELRLLVEEGSPGTTPMNERWKMCQIDVNDHMALPNGWSIEPQGGDCEVWGVAL